ncbi:MAG: hypothetical protein WA634_05450 [Silvibacterium sp.]
MKTTTTPSVETRKPSWPDVLLVCFLAISLAGNVIQGWKVKSLMSLVPSSKAHTGMLLSKLNARTVSGSVQQLSFGQGKTVILYFFKPKCRWCATNIENIRSFSRQRSGDLRFIGIATTGEDLPASLEKLPLPFPIYVIDDPSELRQVDFLGTPQTVEIAPSGKVVNNWVGAFQPSTAAAIEKRFAIHLPGLVPGEGK